MLEAVVVLLVLGASPVLVVDAPSEDPLSLDPPELDPPELDPASSDALDEFDVFEVSDPPSSWLARDVPELAVARRSFFAQPEPLKWIAGAANAFLTGPPPHRRQLVGSSAWTPRRISNRLPQFAQS